jgi:hypothetical protein
MENTYNINETEKQKLLHILVSAFHNAQSKWTDYNFKKGDEINGMLLIYNREMIDILECHRKLITMKPQLDENEESKNGTSNDGLPF